jgi:tetratricopeptide (TPR) repeat protein
MKDSGWVESDGTATEGPTEDPGIDIPSPSEVADAEPISPTDFPDWLTDMSRTDIPSDEIDTPESPDQMAKETLEEESLDWITGEPETSEPRLSLEADLPQIDQISDPPPSEIEQLAPSFEVPEVSDSSEDVSDPVSEPDTETESPSPDFGVEQFVEKEGIIPSETQELPPWLEDDAPGASETIVTWLGDKSKEDAPPPSDDIPSWMRGTGPLIDLPEELQQESVSPIEGEGSLSQSSEDERLALDGDVPSLFEGSDVPSIDEILSGKTAEIEGKEPISVEGEHPALDKASEDESPAWLQEIADIEEEPIISESVEAEDAPKWVKELPVEDESVPRAEAADDAPEWLSEIDDTQPTPVLEGLDDDDRPPEWLAGIAGKDPDVSEEVAEAEQQPEWLKEIAEEELDQGAELDKAGTEPPEWLAGIGVPEEKTPSAGADEEPPEWIQTLADEEVADLETPSEDEEPPGWITELLPADEAEIEQIEEDKPPEWVETGVYEGPDEDVLDVEDEPIAAGDELPTDSELAAAEAEIISVEEAVIATEEEDLILDDQVGSIEEAVEEIVKVEAEPAEEPVLQAEDAPDWLVDISKTDEPAPGDTPSESAPEWLQEVEISEIDAVFSEDVEETDLKESIIGTESSPDEIQPDTAWEPEFEEPVAEDEPDTEEFEAAEKEIESRLDWLQDSAQAITPEPEGFESEEAILDEVPEVVPPSSADLPEEAEIQAVVEKEIGELEAELDKEVGDEKSEIDEEIDEAVAAIEGFAEPLATDIDDGEVSSFLEELAESEKLEDVAETPIMEQEIAEDTVPQEKKAESIIEDDELPEDVEGGLEWLEQLATEDQIEDIVSPELPITSDEVVDADVPDWLQEVAETAEEFSDEEAEKAMLETLEDLEPDLDPSILDTIISRRSDLEEYASGLASEESPGVEEPLAEQELKSGVTPPTSEPEVEDFVDQVETEKPIDEIEIPSEATATVEEPTVEEVAEELIVESPPMNMLERARSAVQDGDLDQAIENYILLINQKIELESVIEDLRSALNRTPDVPILWQTLGDALMQSGEITEAIDAYRRGMEAV